MGERMSLGLWPFLPSLGCVRWIVPVNENCHMQGYPLVKTPTVQNTTLSVCVHIFLYIRKNYQKNIKYIKIKIFLCMYIKLIYIAVSYCMKCVYMLSIFPSSGLQCSQGMGVRDEHSSMCTRCLACAVPWR